MGFVSLSLPPGGWVSDIQAVWLPFGVFWLGTAGSGRSQFQGAEEQPSPCTRTLTQNFKTWTFCVKLFAYF